MPSFVSTCRVLLGCLLAVCVFTIEAAPPPALQWVPVVSSGLSSPIFVTHAGDATNRLFIAEQRGVVDVLQPGASVATAFLDIRTRVLAGGERGLLGLAFHPHYASNGRFFVYYTRVPDGAVIVAEYSASADPNVANGTGTTLLEIAHPVNANHNGGMLAFGPDGYLYVGVGDGGSAYDPPNNAQNVNVLLGKILRIDVDHPDAAAGTPYSSPGDNPYAGGGGRAEIFSIGWRNPWRFSFDRSTHQLWVADVGQDALEEVDTPIVNGGNYGWRVYEGSGCTGKGPAVCKPANYLFPAITYPHTDGRCSITGGYVYRGAQGTLPLGTYVYADFCTGEIIAWNGTAQEVLLDTAMNIASFGEDEQGEIYVVDLGGTVGRITSADAICTYGISPSSRSIRAPGGGGSVTVTAPDGCAWTAASNAPWIHASAAGSGDGDVAYSVDANPSSSTRTGTMTIAGRTFSLKQRGATPCKYVVSPTSVAISAKAKNRTVTVTAPSGCAWSAASNAAWITIVNGSSGVASGTVTYSVGALPGRLAQRSGTMTVAGTTVKVVQSR